MPLSSKVSITATGIHGFCWFAGEDISAGENIWWKRADGAPNTDLFLTRAQIAALDPVRHAKFTNLVYQVDDDLFCGFDPDVEPLKEELVEDYINHSCDGNTWYLNPDLLVARRDIKKGEEITYDYVLTEANPEWILAEKCLCGASNCRGKVTGNDWKIERLQAEYENHFFPHVNKLIQKSKLEEKKSN